MAGNPVRAGIKRLYEAVVVLLVTAVGVRVAWALMAPVVPVLVSLAVVIAVMWAVLVGRRS